MLDVLMGPVARPEDPVDDNTAPRKTHQKAHVAVVNYENTVTSLQRLSYEKLPEKWTIANRQGLENDAHVCSGNQLLSASRQTPRQTYTLYIKDCCLILIRQQRIRWWTIWKTYNAKHKKVNKSTRALISDELHAMYIF